MRSQVRPSHKHYHWEHGRPASTNVLLGLRKGGEGDARARSEALREWQAILMVVSAGIAALVPIMIWGIPSGSDLYNHYRFALPFYEGIRSGSLYPGWLAESNAGFGDPRFRFYPPGLYYLLAAGRMFMGWYSASLATFSLLSVVGALGVYFWARVFYPPKLALWAGVAYALAPFHLNELYQASLLSEYAACSVLPFAFAFVDRICRKGTAADVAGLAAAFALLVLTHLPLTVIGSLSLVFYGVLRIEKEAVSRTLAQLALAFSMGLIASAFFWTTVLAELPWIKGNSVNPNAYYDYRANFLFSPAALTNLNTWYANLTALAVLGYLLPALVLVKKIFLTKKASSSFRATFVLTVVSFLMATELSRPIWILLPKLQEVQFPWRWLSITSMSGSLLLAASIPRLREIWKNGLRPSYLIPVLGFALSLLFVGSQVVWDCNYVQRSEFASLLQNIRGASSFKDWLPLWARDVTHLQAPKNEVEAGSRPITINSWTPEDRRFVISSGPATEARVRTYFYPHWIAAANGKRLETRAAEDGLLLISIPPETTNVEMKFSEPRRVGIGRAVSAIGWILIGLIALVGQSRNGLFRLAGRRVALRENELVIINKV